MSKKKSISGRYIARSHSTVTPFGQQIVRMLDESRIITKVSLGIINPKSGSSLKRLRIIREDPNGLRLIAIESSSSQELYVSAPDRERVIKHLEEWCKKENLRYFFR